MPRITKKALDQFMRENPNLPVTQSIKEQLEKITQNIQSVDSGPGLASESTQNRSTASDLTARQINQLHLEVLNGFNNICHMAITIGKLLIEQKNAVGHGNWLDWVSQLKIGPRQIENYMKIYRERDSIMEAMNTQIEAGVKPSIRKMLLAASTKDNQSTSDYLERCQKNGSHLTAKEKKQRHKDEKRQKELSTLTQMYITGEIDDKSLRALVLKWNRENSDNYELFVEDILKQAEESSPSDLEQRSSSKINMMLSVDVDLWDDFNRFGGCEAFLYGYVRDFMEQYIIEQKSFRVAN
ncbi:MAG: DUF3102 domain-containing protein [Planctomycetota bacterium]